MNDLKKRAGDNINTVDSRGCFPDLQAQIPKTDIF